MKTEINLWKFNVSSIKSNAGIYFGENAIKGWQTHSKSNNSLGRVNGDCNTIASRISLLSDPDFIDMLVKKLKQ